MLKQIYKTICNTNDKIIGEGKDVESFAFFIKDDDATTIPLQVTLKNHQQLALDIKSAALKKGVDGYILVLNMKPILKQNCCIRVLYTRNEKLTEIIWHANGKINRREELEGRGLVLDMWDAWNIIADYGVKTSKPLGAKNEPNTIIIRFDHIALKCYSCASHYKILYLFFPSSFFISSFSRLILINTKQVSISSSTFRKRLISCSRSIVSS